MRQGSGSQWRIRSHLDCKTVSRRQVPGGSGADLIGNVAGGTSSGGGGELERSRGIGGAAVVEC